MNGYNFTDRVRKVLQLAREEASRLNHEYVGVEHILLGLVREGGGLAATVLADLKVEPADIRCKIEELVRPGRPGYGTGPDLPYTSRAKKVLEFAMAEARHLGHSSIGTEHLLLGLLRANGRSAAAVLPRVGLTLENVREAVRHRRPPELRPVVDASLSTARAALLLALAALAVATVALFFALTR